MSLVYNRAKKQLLDATINLTSATIKAMLVTAAYVANADHDFVSDGPAANELSGTGYVAGYGGAGRKALSGKTVAEDDANDRGYWDANDLSWLAINAGTAAALILFVEGAADASSTLIAYINTGGFPIVTNGGDMSVQWSNSPVGILQLT